jgi:hypothetical protein
MRSGKEAKGKSPIDWRCSVFLELGFPGCPFGIQTILGADI